MRVNGVDVVVEDVVVGNFAGVVATVAVLCVRVFVVEVDVVVVVEVVMSVAERCSPCHVCGCRR